MPRSGGGAYSLPAGSLVTDGIDDILASQHNGPLQDIATDLNTARPIVAGGTGATTAADARTNLGLALPLAVASGGTGQTTLAQLRLQDPIINGAFDVWQRAASGTANGYTAADRWGNFFTGGTVTQARQAFAVDTVFGANNPAFFLRQSVSGQTGTNFANTQQRIEDVRTFAGQTVTILGWAKRNSGTGNLGVRVLQNFGTGGSPSTEVALTQQVVTLTTSWAPFAATFALPTMAGKTLGTDGNSYLAIVLDASDGSLALGVQTIEVDRWGIHMRLGTVAAADAVSYVAPSRHETLAACQRYFAAGTTGGPTNADTLFNAGAVATGPFTAFPVTMRTAPTMAYADLAGTASRFSDLAGTVHNQIPTSGTGPVGNATVHGFIPDFAASGSGLSRWRINWTAAAEL